MGIILEFRRGEEPANAATRPLSGSLGEIIIFTGVRIDRSASSDRLAQAGTPSRRRAQRGRKK